MSTQSRKRIAHVITRLDLGGAQQNTLYCVTHHDRSVFEVDLVAGTGGLLDQEAGEIPDLHLFLTNWLRYPISPLRDALALFRLWSHFRRRRIQLVHTHSSKAGLLGRVAAALAGVPFVVHTAHGWSFNPTQGPLRRWFYSSLEKMAALVTDKLVVVTALHRETGLAAGIGRPDKYAVIHSGIEPERFARPSRSRADIRAELGYEEEDIVVGTLSCLKAQKAPLDFVRAAARAHAKEPRVRFFLAGDGVLDAACRQLASELEIEHVISFLGWRTDAADLLHAMDVFLLTSLFEGLPRSVLQAMAAGTPVVATAVDGTPEVVIDGESGLLVSPGVPDEAAEAILRVAQDPELRSRCVTGGRAQLTGSFDIAVMLEELEAVFEDLLSGCDEKS